MAGEAILLMGLPGSGKSTLLRAVLERVPGAVVDRDRIRAALFPRPFDARSEKDAANLAVWAALEAHLRHGHRVYVDGMTFASQSNRDQAAAIARAHGATVRQVFLDVPVEVCAQRIAAQQGHPSPERRPQLAYEVAARFAPLAPGSLRLDGLQPLAELVSELATWLSPAHAADA